MPRKEIADFSKIRNHPIAERISLVSRGSFSDIGKYKKTGKISDLLPSILKGKDIIKIADKILFARANKRLIFFGMGGHLIKVGLAPLLIEMMKEGFLNAIAFNGSFAIHDLEIAYHGKTSEDVLAEIKSGRFGMAEETAKYFNEGISFLKDKGAGESLGRYILSKKMSYFEDSVLANAATDDIPAMCHIGIGCDIVHLYKDVSGEQLGRSSLYDFKLFVSLLQDLRDGGVFINIGSAVTIPEVFIKALSAARNLYGEISNFTTVNFDMLPGYRPLMNVVKRTVEGEGKGYSVTGHHEILLPLLYCLLRERC